MIILRYLAVVLVALDMGMALCHTLAMPAKLAASGEEWLLFQHTLYREFGAAGPGAVIEIGAIIGTLALAWAVRKRRRSFVLTVVAAVCVSAAFFVVWIAFVAPVNTQTAQWTAATLPADWTRWRAQWEYAHAARFGLHFLGFSALVVSLLFDAKTNSDSARAG